MAEPLGTEPRGAVVAGGAAAVRRPRGAALIQGLAAAVVLHVPIADIEAAGSVPAAISAEG